jgi:hypothetical protein
MNNQQNFMDDFNDVDKDLSQLLQQTKLSKLTSHNPLEKIKRNLLINMIFGFVICGIYIFIISYFKIWQVQIAISIVLIFSLWALYTAWIQYKKIETHVPLNRSLLVELKQHYNSINHWIASQQKVAIVIYPISATGGFILGGVMGSGKSVEIIMSKPIILIALAIALIILVPACYYLAKWMSNYSFGKHLKTLAQNIKDLEAEK